jgi:hypothetical protein
LPDHHHWQALLMVRLIAATKHPAMVSNEVEHNSG